MQYHAFQLLMFRICFNICCTYSPFIAPFIHSFPGKSHLFVHTIFWVIVSAFHCVGHVYLQEWPTLKTLKMWPLSLEALISFILSLKLFLLFWLEAILRDTTSTTFGEWNYEQGKSKKPCIWCAQSLACIWRGKCITGWADLRKSLGRAAWSSHSVVTHALGLFPPYVWIPHPFIHQLLLQEPISCQAAF